MSRWLLPLVAAAFWTGIVVAGAVRLSGMAPSVALLLGGLTILGGLTASVRPRRRQGSRVDHGPAVGLPAALLAFAVLGAGWAGVRASRLTSSPLLALTGTTVVITGSAGGDPSQHDSSWSVPVRVGVVRPIVGSAGEGISAHETVWAEGRGPPPSLVEGDRIKVIGALEVPRGAFGDGLRRQGFVAILSGADIRMLGSAGGILAGPAQSLRAALASSLRQVFPSREAGLLMGLILGDTSRLDPVVAETFQATGLTHLLAVSGENLAMFLGPLIGFATLLRAGRRARLAVGLLGTGFFVVLARGEPSVLRAAAMATISLWGVFLGRPRDGTAVLGGAVLAVLVVDPTLTYSIGFQLSATATFGMVTLATPIAKWLAFLPSGLALASGATVGAQIGVTPILLHAFGVVPVVTLLANILAYPAVAPGMLFGLAAAAAAIPTRPVGFLLARISIVPLRYLESVARHLAHAPIPSLTANPGSLAPLLAAPIALIAWRLWARARHRRAAPGALEITSLARRRIRIAVAVCMTLPLLAWTEAGWRPPDALTVVFFGVLGGDAALVRSPEGAAILVDAGMDSQEVARRLASIGVHRLDVVVATRTSDQQVGGLPAILARLPTGLVLDPPCGMDGPGLDATQRALEAVGSPVRHPMPEAFYRAGDVSIRIVAAPECGAGDPGSQPDESLVLLVSTSAGSVLFAGTAGDAQLRKFATGADAGVRCQALQIAGGLGGEDVDALAATTGARLGVVGSSSNAFGRPSVPNPDGDTTAGGVRVFRTAPGADVIITIERGRVTVASGRG